MGVISTLPLRECPFAYKRKGAGGFSLGPVQYGSASRSLELRRMRLSVDQLAAFVAVVELGSFSKAAQCLAVSKSIVSRRIALLEEHLGVRLLSRSTHFVTLTPLGHTFNGRARGIPAEIVLDLCDRPCDPFTDGADFAIRIGNLKDSTLVSRYFKPVRQVLVCSPDYAERYGTQAVPRDLANHDCLVYEDPFCPAPWRFQVNGEWESAKPFGRLRTNSPSVALEGAQASLGIAALPMFVASSAIDRGALMRLLPGFPLKELGLQAVFPPNPMLPEKVRAVVEFLAARWKKPLPEPTAVIAVAPKNEPRLVHHILGPPPSDAPAWMSRRAAGGS
jgi:DNA-binding transcriptional LysR family regulator